MSEAKTANHPQTSCGSTEVQLWTDGSCRLGEVAGYAWALVSEDKILTEGGGKLQPLPGAGNQGYTAPRAELSAMEAGIRYLDGRELYNKVSVYSDSSFVVKTLTEWGPARTPKAWKGKAYAEEFQQLLSILESWRKRGTTVSINHVPGHKGIVHNEYVDKLARKYMEA